MKVRDCFLAWTFAYVVVASACSADPSDHPDRVRPGGKCDEGLREYKGFCVRRDRVADSGTQDGGPDAGKDAGGDSDGSVRESCNPAGAQLLCYPHPDMATAQQSPCRPGLRTCGEDHLWSDCEDFQIPEPERCDGRDNDCDGRNDEGTNADPSEEPCKVTNASIQGACAENGFSLCRGGRQECIQLVTPAPESCNGIDDDCDGTTDEGIDVACYGGSSGCTASANGFDCTPASTCAPGWLRCIDGQMQTECTDDVRPRDESATMQNETPLDEDCDGMIDEGFDCQDGDEYPCYSGPASTRGRGPCKDGKQLCTNGMFGACTGEVTPKPETCANEGTDDDCDGIQDDVPRRGSSCSDESNAQGVCRASATWQCVGTMEMCVNGLPSSEICDGRNEDEDCDGAVDEDFNKQLDELNCGACGMRCSAGQTCCDGNCVNTSSSNGHCNGCGMSCAPGLTCCSGACVNTRTHQQNCGTCGKGCLLGCSNGNCIVL